MATEDEMVGWHHQLNGHEFEQTLGDSEGQGSLACCSSWGYKESDMNDSDDQFSVCSLLIGSTVMITCDKLPNFTNDIYTFFFLLLGNVLQLARS